VTSDPSLPLVELPASGPEELARLVDLLDLEQVEENIYRGRSPQVFAQRVFGGQVAGQALVAAGRTVEPGLDVHSLHAYFIRPGDPAVPLVYMVERVRDGRSFSVRRVSVVQHGKTIFTMSASFQVEQDMFEHRTEMPDVPSPETLPTLEERIADRPEVNEQMKLIRPFDIRWVTTPPWEQVAFGRTDEPMRLWMRTHAPLPDDTLVHDCALTFASDMTLMDTVFRQQGVDFFTGNITSASLDHAMWFHRPFRTDEWLLYDCQSVSASGSRGLAMSKVFSADGSHIVTVMQEGVLRFKTP
jgi:acyl-CoA thioesterase-2